MLLLLDLILTIVSAICAVFLLLLGIVLVLGKLPLRGMEQPGSRGRPLFGIAPVANAVNLPPEPPSRGSRDIRPLPSTASSSTAATQLRVPRAGAAAATARPVLANPFPSRTRRPLLPSPPSATKPPLAEVWPTTDSSFSETDPPKAQRSPTGDIAPPETPPDSNSAQSSALLQTQEKLLIQLLRRLEGDVERRDRLIQHAQQNHPGQSDLWYLEKVTQDLEGDRGR